VSRLLVLWVALWLGACSNKVYLDSWQPERLEHQRGLTRLLSEALAMRAVDLPRVNAAGGVFLGHHEADTGWARRVASTGGTHFIAVEHGAATMRSECVIHGVTQI
jgi:hypothetical protein